MRARLLTGETDLTLAIGLAVMLHALQVLEVGLLVVAATLSPTFVGASAHAKVHAMV